MSYADEKVMEAIKALSSENIPSLILTVDKDSEEIHMTFTGEVGHIGVSLETILEGVKEDSDGIYEHHKILVRLLFMALSRVYTEEELVVRIRAWKKKFGI